MNEKPEAWTAADSLIWPHLAAKLIREQHAEIERLREFLLDIRKDAAASHWHRDIDAALRREET